MVDISRRLISQVAASVAALVVAAVPTSGLVAVGTVQPGGHAALTSTVSTASQAIDRAAVARQIPPHAASRHDVDPDVLHHWFP